MVDSSWAEYIDLISDASTDLYKENHGSKFTNRLVVPQHLPENCYVALRELEFIYAFHNVQVQKNTITVYDWLYKHEPNTERNPNPYPTYGKFVNCSVKEGLYDTFPALCEGFNQSLKDSGLSELKDRNVFSYNKRTMKFSYDVDGAYVSIFLKGDVLNFLGIEKEKAGISDYVVLGRAKDKPTYVIEVPKDPKKPEGEKIKEIRHLDNPKSTWESTIETKDEFTHIAQIILVTSFVVYVNIIESQVTGDVFSDALRIIPINKQEPGSNAIVKFDTPYYLKVNRRHIPTITVEIRSLEGDLIKFLIGRTRVKLQFTTKP